MGSDQHPQAGGIDQPHIGEVENHRLPEQSGYRQRIAQGWRNGGVDIAIDPHHRRGGLVINPETPGQRSRTGRPAPAVLAE
ncbi:hypothetical protein GCM10027280_41940 [Micromonospora polyrhachis]